MGAATPGGRRARRDGAAGALLLAALLVAAAAAAGGQIDEEVARAVFPGAEAVGLVTGEPPAAPVYRDGRLAGYVFRTDDVLPIPAYSGKPVAMAVGIDLAGRITGVRILHHEEPILVVGVTPEHLRRFIGQYAGLNVRQRVQIGGFRPGFVHLDGLTGATITAMVMNASIMRAARRVAESRGIVEPSGGAGTTAGSAAAAGEPLWVESWRRRRPEIAVLGAGLAVLVWILLFEDWLARRPRILRPLRRLYLVWTLAFVGWIALGQLSIVNVLTFVHALMGEFRWETFLVDPALFILWSFVALVLILWGRGVYCGWLCPFGAAQELIQQGAQALRLPQLELPSVVHERLWALKYVIAVGLFGLSLQSVGEAVRYAEVEPFKTVFSLHFQRGWPFVAWALALLAASAVNRKFFCKYLCPLGAALAIPARLKIFDWLRRRRECGRPCQICANECEVRAIRATGEINPNECHYCLDCQITYWDDRRCPPLVERRLRRERAARRARGVAVAPPARRAGRPQQPGR